MRICFFGTYTVAEGYPVNRVLIKGLRRAGAQVDECREELWGGFLHQFFSQRRWHTWLRLGWRALGCYLRLVRRYWRLPEHGCVIVGYAGYLDVLLASLLSRRPVVLVAFISLYDTIVADRGQLAANSWKARLLKSFERLGFARADLVLVDTWEHARYLADFFGLPPARFQRSFVGEDDECFPPAQTRTRQGEGFRVLFFGTYVPLHGIEAIVEAADQLREEPQVEFVLIGQGQLYPQIRRDAEGRRLPNLRFVAQWASPAELAAQMRAADVCLGIFGRTPKAARVIPLKVFAALALGRPVITRDSPAIRELLEHEDSALLCAPGDGGALAGDILRLCRDPQLARRLAERGQAQFRREGAPEAVARRLLQTLEARLGS